MSNERLFKIVTWLVVINGLYLIALGFVFSSWGAGLLGVAFIVSGIINSTQIYREGKR